ncbi:MAG: FAD-binding oxidoreductase [Dehalococcoidia bacterium]
MAIKENLIKIVGSENVSDKPADLERSSTDHSLCSPRLPNYLARPQTAEEVLKIVNLANETSTPLIPSSSGVHFNGGAVPNLGGITVDLSRMNKVLYIDENNRKARIEPGVTWSQLQGTLAKKGYMPLFPLLPHSQKSVLTSHLERERLLIPRFEFDEPLLTTEVVWPRGEIFRTGAAAAGIGEDTGSIARGAFPHGPGLDWWRMFQGAQGTFGILTWGNIKIEILPQVNKAFFMPFEDVGDAIELMYRVGRKVIGYEFLMLDRINLAAILSDGDPKELERLRGMLAPWTLILVLSGAPVRPHERIEYEEETLHEIAAELSLANIQTSLAGLPGMERKIVDKLRSAWPKDKTYWKWVPEGESEDLFFLTTLDKTPAFVNAILDTASMYDYPAGDVGCYIQPIESSRACHCEFNFFYDPADPLQVARVTDLYAEAARVALDLGAFYSRPYGILADLVYPRATGYTMMLKKTKTVIDPNNIMNPGRLCF